MSESTKPRLVRVGHAQHCKVCLQGLPASQVEVDASTCDIVINWSQYLADTLSDFSVALAFYCLGALDLLDTLKTKTNELDRQNWIQWIWEQQTRSCQLEGMHVASRLY